MKATVLLKSGRVKVQYCTAHITRAQYKDEIAAKLQQGVTMDRILDDIRDSVPNGINREHQVTRKDLHNTKKNNITLKELFDTGMT